MKITTTVTLRTGEPGAYEFVYPGESINLSREEAETLIQRGFAADDKACFSKNEPGKTHHLVDAILDAIEDLKPNDFGKDGKPAVKAIEDIIGQSISASDRDKAWDEYQALINDG
jgi:hypothetical protein